MAVLPRACSPGGGLGFREWALAPEPARRWADRWAFAPAALTSQRQPCARECRLARVLEEWLRSRPPPLLTDRRVARPRGGREPGLWSSCSRSSRHRSWRRRGGGSRAKGQRSSRCHGAQTCTGTRAHTCVRAYTHTQAGSTPGPSRTAGWSDRPQGLWSCRWGKAGPPSELCLASGILSPWH